MSQKLIPFYIIKVLEEETDKDNPLRAKQIQDKVNQLAISDSCLGADEKLIKKTDTVVENILTMNEFYHRQHGEYLIGECKGKEPGAYKKNNHYYLAIRPMEFEEVHFLHRFALGQKNLTQEQSLTLAGKLENLLNSTQRKRLKYSMTHDGTKGTGNGNVYKNMDILNECISKKTNIKFDYYEYSIKKELVKRKRDYDYIVSPYEIKVSSGKYYLEGYHLPTKMVRHYRIDKMMDVKEEKELKLPYFEIKDNNRKNRSSGATNMFMSEECGNIKIRCKVSIRDQVVEKFESASLYTDPDPQYFKATLKSVSYDGTMLWLKAHCDQCEVMEPDKIKDRIQNELSNALKQYT